MTVQYWNASGAQDWTRGDELPTGTEFMKAEFVEQYREAAIKWTSMTHEYWFGGIYYAEASYGMTYQQIIYMFNDVIYYYEQMSEHDASTDPWWASFGGVIRNSDINEMLDKASFNVMDGEATYNAVGLRHVISIQGSWGEVLESPLRFKYDPSDADYVYSPWTWWTWDMIPGVMANQWVFEDMRMLLPALHMMVFPFDYYMWKTGSYQEDAGTTKTRDKRYDADDPENNFDSGWVEDDYSRTGMHIRCFSNGSDYYRWTGSVTEPNINTESDRCPGEFTYHMMVKWTVESGDGSHCEPQVYKDKHSALIDATNREMTCPYPSVTGYPMSVTDEYEYDGRSNPDGSFFYQDAWAGSSNFWVVAEIDSPFREDWI